MRIIEREPADNHANLRELAKSYQRDSSANVQELMDEIKIFDD